MKRFLSTLGAMLLGVALGACATPGAQAPEEIRMGVIEQINPTKLEGEHHVGMGAIVGGIGGAAIGSLFGSGTGKDVMIAAGAIAGAVGGQYVENKYDKPKAGQQIIVRLNSGVLVAISQPENPALYKGQKVYIEGSGQSTRVSPR